MQKKPSQRKQLIVGSLYIWLKRKSNFGYPRQRPGTRPALSSTGSPMASSTKVRSSGRRAGLALTWMPGTLRPNASTDILHLNKGLTIAVHTMPGLVGNAGALPKSRHEHYAYLPTTQELPKSYPRDTQGIPKGPTGSQHRSNTLASPLQYRGRAPLTPGCRSCPKRQDGALRTDTPCPPAQSKS